MQTYEAATGAPLGTLILDAGNSNPLGIAWNNDSVNDAHYVDDYVNSFIFHTDDLGTS